MLRGDEVGVLLGAHVIERGVDPGGAHAVLARSIVSSRLLGAMAEAAGVPGVETLTGFKWIGRVPRLRYGYEEAIGYCVDPAHVADKDGISAALLVADMVAGLRAQGRTLLDVLDDLARAHGLYATDAFSVRVEDLSLIGVVMARLRANPATEIGGVAVDPPRRSGRRRRAGPPSDRGPPLPPGRRHPRDRAPQRHGAEAEDLPGGDRPPERGPRRGPGGSRPPPGANARGDGGAHSGLSDSARRPLGFALPAARLRAAAYPPGQSIRLAIAERPGSWSLRRLKAMTTPASPSRDTMAIEAVPFTPPWWP